MGSPPALNRPIHASITIANGWGFFPAKPYLTRPNEASMRSNGGRGYSTLGVTDPDPSPVIDWPEGLYLRVRASF